jgi:hypothetical protein
MSCQRLGFWSHTTYTVLTNASFEYKANIQVSVAAVAAAAAGHHCCAVQAEGSVLAFYNPRFGRKGPGGSSSSSSGGGLAVSQGVQVELLATSAGWGFCKGTTKVRCWLVCMV